MTQKNFIYVLKVREIRIDSCNSWTIFAVKNISTIINLF